MKHLGRITPLRAAAVLILPALLALYLTSSSAPEREPKVTRVIGALSDAQRAKRASVRSDSPVAKASLGGRDLSIDFERGRRVPLGIMEIPTIGLRTPFFDGVVDEAVELGPGHWPGTPWPGQAGNSVFAGHRTTYTHPFGDLDLLENGERVRVKPRNGEPTTYRVFRTTIATEAEYAGVVLKQPKNERARIITLFACTPKGSRSHRIIVQARATPVGANGDSEETR
jgi:LPXTG-site transpeptidase (sortase) family protein